MGKLKIGSCSPTKVYLVIEKVHHLIGWGKVTANGINVGIDASKVYRQVHQACMPQDRFIDGVNVGDEMPTGWQYIKEQLGIITISTRLRPNAKIIPVMVYSGGVNLVSVGTWKHKKIPISDISYGIDPAPKVKMFGNPKTSFHSAGGQGLPTAMVIYDPSNKKEPIYEVPKKERAKVMSIFRAKAARYRQ